MGNPFGSKLIESKHKEHRILYVETCSPGSHFRWPPFSSGNYLWTKHEFHTLLLFGIVVKGTRSARNSHPQCEDIIRVKLAHECNCEHEKLKAVSQYQVRRRWLSLGPHVLAHIYHQLDGNFGFVCPR